MGEFDLIARYFNRSARPGSASGPVALGIGDDCALLQPRPRTQMAVSSDMLVEGQHFFADVDPAALGHKALAVNLSDLAACGAQPLAFTLALALPQIDADWLAGFSNGLFALADQHGCTLIGGDTTRGPLNICITVFGEIPVGQEKPQALLRSGACAGDDIYVSGHLGDARLALEVMRGNVQVAPPVLQRARARLERPTPRIALGLALRGVASAAIDVSDGLLGDLAHLLAASRVGATVRTDLALQLMAARSFSAPGGTSQVLTIPESRILEFVLAGGDDYELAFTAPPDGRGAVLAAAQASQTPVTCIGHIDAASGLRLLDAEGEPVENRFLSFDHFK